MSRSFSDIGPRFLKFSSFKVFSITGGLIEITLHYRVQYICSWDMGQMTKRPVMFIYSKGFEILQLRNWKTDDHETWYAVLGLCLKPIKQFEPNLEVLILWRFCFCASWSIFLPQQIKGLIIWAYIHIYNVHVIAVVYMTKLQNW